MASSPGQSLAQESNISRGTEAGISVNLLLFGGNLVERAFEAAMEEVQENNDNEVVRKDKQEGDEQEMKSANEAAGSSTDNYAATRSSEQDKVEDGDGIDQVDFAAMTNQPAPLQISQLQDSHNGQPAVEEHKGKNSEVPKIEVTSTNTQSNSSPDEDSADREERKSKNQTGKGEQDDDDEKEELKDEVKKLRKENETLKKNNNSLEESLKEERSKIERLGDELRREKEELDIQLKQSSDLQSSTAEKDENIVQLTQQISQLQGSIQTLKKDMEDVKKEKEEVLALSQQTAKDYDNKMKQLETENKDKGRQLEETSENMNRSLTSLHDQEKMTSSLQEEVASLQKELANHKEKVTKEQENGRKLQNKLITAEERISHLDNTVQRLSEKNKLLENKGSEIEQKATQEAKRKLQNRIQELERKVIKVNEEKEKIKTDYDDAVKALEAVEKVYSVREIALEKYKADYEEATDKIKENDNEIAKLKSDLSKNKEKLTRALEYKADREELKDHLRKSKEAIALQREETEQVRKDLDEERHSLKMAQARAQERGRKIQVLNLELTEIKDTLQIARNVIDEKENNMKSLRESLAAEKEQKAKLEKELEIVSHLEKKLQYTEEEKHRLQCRLQNTELELKETHTSLEQSNSKRRELDQNVDNLERDKNHLNRELEEKRVEITNLQGRIKEKDQEIDNKLMEIVQLVDSVDCLKDELEHVWTSYRNDRDWWKQRADKVLGRRPKSAPPRRRGGTEFHAGMSLSSRRLMNRMGAPRLNQNYMDSRRKVTRQRPAPTCEEQAPKENENMADGSPGHMSALETSPRPPSTPPTAKPRPRRPASSYGVRSHSPLDWAHDDGMLGSGYYSDMGPVMEETRLNGYDADDEVFSSCVVHKGDKVMIQSKISGEEKMNITGLVKYVCKLGSGGGGSTFVGLKLDQPVGNTSGRIGGRQYFHCPPNYGRVVSDIHAVRNPLTRNYTRIRPMTSD